MVRLSALCLRASSRGRDRGSDAFDMHARVRGPSSYVRLVDQGSRLRPNPPKQTKILRAQSHAFLMSKRLLKKLVDQEPRRLDDPRTLTIAGLRRRGYTPEVIRDFCERIGVAKANSMVEVELLEHCERGPSVEGTEQGCRLRSDQGGHHELS